MNIYFDTEFTGLVPDTKLISIGMVTDRGKVFYAEFTDFDPKLCDDWIVENVLKHMALQRIRRYNDLEVYYYKDVTYGPHKGDMYVCGDSDTVRHNLSKWLEQFKDRQIQLVSDVCHYDMVLFCNLFGGAFNLPKNVSPVCYDICQDIYIYDLATLSMAEAFDKNREKLYLEFHDALPEGSKHNSLYDAKIIKGIYEGMREE